MGRNKLSIKIQWLKKVWKNNPTIALDILYNKEKKYSEMNSQLRTEAKNEFENYLFQING